MANYVSIVLELISGLLLGLEFFVKPRQRHDIDKWLKEKIEEWTDSRLSVLGGLICIAIVIGILANGSIIDSIAGRTFSKIFTSDVIILFTFPLGIIFMLFESFIWKLIPKIRGVWADYIGPFNMLISIIGLVAGFSFFPDEFLKSICLAFASGFMLMTIFIMALPTTRNFLTFHSMPGVIGRAGVLIFIASKSIPLIQIGNEIFVVTMMTLIICYGLIKHYINHHVIKNNITIEKSQPESAKTQPQR